MSRYFIEFCYDGTRYHGWQIQPNGNTVQAELQDALHKILRKETVVVGAGRTDTGVHARMMVAHFDTEEVIDCVQLAYRMNRIVPHDIAVYSVYPVNPDMHARFSATKRTYHYYIHTRKDPFASKFSCEMHYELDFELMNKAAAHLLDVQDFGAFCKSNSDVKTTICSISKAVWVNDDETHWHFVISANRFLRNMVRAVVGTLVEVGRHRLTLEEFDKVVASGNRSNAGESMPGNALFLEKIEY